LNIAVTSIIAKDFHDTSFLQLISDHPEVEKYDLKNNQEYGSIFVLLNNTE